MTDGSSTSQQHRVLRRTAINITQAGIPAAIPTEFCYASWQESLTLLAL